MSCFPSSLTVLSLWSRRGTTALRSGETLMTLAPKLRRQLVRLVTHPATTLHNGSRFNLAVFCLVSFLLAGPSQRRAAKTDQKGLVSCRKQLRDPVRERKSAPNSNMINCEALGGTSPSVNKSTLFKMAPKGKVKYCLI